MKYKINVYLRVLLSVFLSIITLLVPVNSFILATEPTAEAPQEAPLNPDFLKYLQDRATKAPGSFFGEIPPAMDLSHLARIPVERPALREALPAAFDWRTQGKVTSVKDQGQAGTCWVFGTLATLESRVAIVDSQTYDFSEQNLITGVDPAWVYLNGNRVNGGGNNILSTDTLTKKGTRPESAQPYNISTMNTEACNESTPILHRVTDFRIVATLATQITEIKNAVFSFGPVGAGYCHDNAYWYPATNTYYWPNCTTPSNHMITIVGWDDNIPHPAGGGYGAWIVKNSWGTGFGNAGYFYLCYGSANLTRVGSYHGETDVAGYRNYNPSERVYSWDECGLVSSIGWGDTSAWMRNIYTAVKAGNLTHVSFWSPSNNTGYQIYVYDHVTSGLLASKTDTCAEMGYYSIPLNSPVHLNTNQQFRIDVKMTTPGYNYPLPTEKVISGTCQPPIQSGASFIRHLDTEGWMDASTGSTPRNVSLRATVTEDMATYTLTVNTTGQGTVTKTPDQATYSSGAQVQLTANPANGWQFDRWTGPVSNTNSKTTAVTIDDYGKTVTSTFIQTTPLSGKIAFESSRDGNDEIYVMNADGSNLVRLTNNPASDRNPSWSPDGRKIAFASSRDTNNYNETEIYIMSSSGSDIVRLTNNTGFDGCPAWSPDGSKIAFLSSPNPGVTPTNIFLMNADGSNRVQLTSSSGDVRPRWSPDGTKIVFNSGRDGGSQIYSMNADGSNQICITVGSDNKYEPAFSPDGTKIVYKSEFNISIMNADGTNRAQLTYGPTEYHPTWSPDGTKIACTRESGGTEIFIMNADGSNQINSTNHSGFDYWPSWAAGSWIAPAVTTTEASQLTTNSALLNANLSSLGSATSVNVSFLWGTTSGNLPNETPAQAKTTAGAVSFNLTGLTPATTYFYKAKAAGDGTATGDEKSFTTSPAGTTANADISVVMQGGSRPPEGWAVPVTVKFFAPGANVMTATPAYTFNLTTARSGATAACQCTGVVTGTYDITAVSPHTLLSVKRGAIVNGSSVVEIGTLLEGNARNTDNIVNISDFGILALSFSKSSTDTGFDGRADFDRNGIVDIADFGLLAMNFSKVSPIEVP